jgi:hypothetical protein
LGEVILTVRFSRALSAAVVPLLTLFVSLFCSTHPADKRAKHNAIMIIHFMPELKLLKEYNSFSQKEALKEGS